MGSQETDIEYLTGGNYYMDMSGTGISGQECFSQLHVLLQMCGNCCVYIIYHWCYLQTPCLCHNFQSSIGDDWVGPVKKLVA